MSSLSPATVANIGGRTTILFLIMFCPHRLLVGELFVLILVSLIYFGRIYHSIAKYIPHIPKNKPKKKKKSYKHKHLLPIFNRNGILVFRVSIHRYISTYITSIYCRNLFFSGSWEQLRQSRENLLNDKNRTIFNLK